MAEGEDSRTDDSGAATSARSESQGEPLYFFPDASVTEEELQAILAGDDHERRCWAISHLLRFAQWDDIWQYVSRDEVRALFTDIELPDNLRAAWARMLRVEAPVGT